jgi:hypothetical protein
MPEKADGGRGSSATIQQGQWVEAECGKIRPVVLKREIPERPAPIHGGERREDRVAKAIAIIKAIGPPDELHSRHFIEVEGDPSAPGFVYFAHAAGRVKIGYTTNLDRRLMAIGAASPYPVTPLLIIPGTIDDERAHHDKFAKDRIHFEWFRASSALRKFLRGHGALNLLIEAEEEWLKS